MAELTQNVNWMAVIVGALLAFFAGCIGFCHAWL